MNTVPSLIAVQGAPSSCSKRISFNATKFSVNLLLPLYTVAYVPYKIYLEERFLKCDHIQDGTPCLYFGHLGTEGSEANLANVVGYRAAGATQ